LLRLLGGRIHLLIGAPEKGDPSVVMQVLKQTVAQRLLRKARESPRFPNCIMGRSSGTILAETLLRLQCFLGTQEDRETAVHAPQSCKTRLSGQTGVVGLEQLSCARIWGARKGEDGLAAATLCVSKTETSTEV